MTAGIGDRVTGLILASSFVLAVAAQDYSDQGNRRIATYDEDAYDYIYDTNSLDPDLLQALPPPPPPPPKEQPPRRRIVQPPVNRNNNPFANGYGPSRGGGAVSPGLVGVDACKTGAKTVAHESSCDQYYECYGEQGFLQTCPNGLVFTADGRFGLVGPCDYPHNVNCAGRPELTNLLSGGMVTGQEPQQILQDDPCLAKSKIVGDVQYCDRYWECEFGQPELYDCPNGLVWIGRNQGIADGCDYPWRHPNICKNKDLANPPQSTEHCDWLYGIFGHETSCTRYWTCWNGTATEQFCIGGLLYNEETHACDWPQNVAGCQKHPLCKDDANGNVPLGKSCNRYWACQGGYPRLQRCPAMLVFDKQRKRCVTPPTEDCEVPTTNAPPPEEGQQENSGPGGEFDGQQNPNPRRGGQNRRAGGGSGGGGAIPIPISGPGPISDLIN